MKKLVFGIIALLLAGVAAYWFFHRDNDKARDVLPQDATAAMVLEPAELASELGLNLKDIFNLVSSFGDVEGTIDFTKPVYAFTTESGLGGISLNVEDADKLQKLIEPFAAIEEKDGFKWIVKGNDGIGCLDKDKMLLCNVTSPSQWDGVREEMVKLMKQSRQDVPALEKAKEQKGVFHASTALSNIPQQYAASLPAGTDLSKAFYNCGLRIEKKALVYSSKLEGIDNLTLPLAPIKGDMLQADADEPFAWICVNMKGEELLPYLRKVDEIRTALLGLNMFVDLDMMIKAIDGDVMLAMPKLDIRQSMPGIIFTATLNNADFLKNADDWKQVSRRGANDFVMNQDGLNIFFGVRNGKLYLTNSQELAANTTAGGASLKAAKGKYLAASINAGQIIQTLISNPSPMSMMLAIPQIRDLVNAVDRISLNADSPQSFELSVETNKPVKDIIQKLQSLLTGK